MPSLRTTNAVIAGQARNDDNKNSALKEFKMKLEKLQYQLDAVNSVIDKINKNHISDNQNLFANPLWNEPKNIDIKMETGTGKTYVYTRLIHQLKQNFGFFKFIIIVPSLAIKEGTKISIGSDEWKRHFRQEFNNQTISLNIINAGDFSSKKGRRKQIPESLRSYAESSRAEIKNISVLLLNDDMLASKSMSANDYDSTLFGSISCPIEGLRNTKPIVIIDEPHRFKKDGMAWKNITDGLNPQAIIRFGATFPDKTIGIGSNKRTVKDYEDGKPAYELNAVKSFNDGLVKGVHIIYPILPHDGAVLVKYKVKEIERGKKIIFTKSGSNKEFEIAVGQDLSALDAEFGGGITIDSILSANSAALSNDLELHKGMDLIPKMYSFSYQEILLKQALKSHFEKEKENFYRQNTGTNLPKIKTNSLFFIDSIASFRGGQDGEKGWLRIMFEEILKKQLKTEIKKADGGYKDFLKYSLANVSKTIAGYFAQDNAKDDEIADEVNKVLRDKEQSLKFKDETGAWNICRFFFSKWTLCEGWDNPNVFVICKLRSSGSEIRKLQEVGRGLRLPFDENGTRVSSQNSNEDFRLSYIVDYSEKDFAQKLCAEINEDGAKIMECKITDEILEQLTKAKYEDTHARCKGKLLFEEIIDENDAILDSEKLFSLLPEDSKIKLRDGKITSADMPKRPKAHINKENFEKLKSLWKKVTKRHILHFETLDGDLLERTIRGVLKQKDIFVLSAAEIREQTIQTQSGEAVAESLGYNSSESSLGILHYGEFLKRLNKRTSLPISLLNKSIIFSREELKTSSDFFNATTIENIVKAFETKFREIFAQLWTYQELDYNAKTSLICADGSIVSEFEIGLLGNKKVNGDFLKKEKYLYTDAIVAYDSDIELQVLKVKPTDEVIVYGKLPKGSIKAPTYTGGTTSPDFVYAIRNKSKKIELNLIVETKSDNPRLSDMIAVKAQEKLFEQMGNNIKWRMVTDIGEFERDLRRLSE
ncbi:MAG: type III restriction-modification system endonuclease [Elusimicrobiota bacterium]|jgi:type III restriction enzyme|nr:type III restriction-modification system endonuclease [Elusimicrobiota bacterium]